MRERYEEIQATGVRVVAIGMGRVDMAAHFKTEFDVPFTLLVDAGQETYSTLDMKHGSLWDVAGPHMWVDFTRRLLKGQRPAGVQGDVMQMGGVAVIEPGGKISFVHRGENPADNLPIDRLLTKL